MQGGLHLEKTSPCIAPKKLNHVTHFLESSYDLTENETQGPAMPLLNVSGKGKRICICKALSQTQ